MNKSGFSIDATDFEKKFAHIVKDSIPSLGGKGLFDAGNEVTHDAITLPPQAPKDKGDLWDSRITEKANEDPTDISVTTGFNIEYATKMHEAEPGTYNYTTDKGASSPGPKFLESKLTQFKNKYMAIVAAVIKAGSR